MVDTWHMYGNLRFPSWLHSIDNQLDAFNDDLKQNNLSQLVIGETGISPHNKQQFNEFKNIFSIIKKNNYGWILWEYNPTNFIWNQENMSIINSDLKINPLISDIIYNFNSSSKI
jgi:hypothetical protein